MIPVILRAVWTGGSWLARKSFWPTVVVGGAATVVSSQGKEGPLQNFLTNSFTTVTSAWEEAESEARWQGTYKGLFKIMEFLENSGFSRFLDPLLKFLGTSVSHLKQTAIQGLTEDNVASLTRNSSLDVEQYKPEENGFRLKTAFAATPLTVDNQGHVGLTSKQIMSGEYDLESIIRQNSLPSFQAPAQRSFTDTLSDAWNNNVVSPVSEWWNKPSESKLSFDIK